MRVFGVILAGGGGRRMGGADKASLMLGGTSLVARAVARLSPQVEALAISANGDPARLSLGHLAVLPDATSQGPLSGLRAALDWAGPAGATAVVTVAVDTPFFPDDLVPQLLLAAERSASGVALARSGGQVHPTFGLWPVTLRDVLVATLARGEARVMDFAGRHDAKLADFPDPVAFLNLNTPEHLAQAERLIEQRA